MQKLSEHDDHDEIIDLVSLHRINLGVNGKIQPSPEIRWQRGRKATEENKALRARLVDLKS